MDVQTGIIERVNFEAEVTSNRHIFRLIMFFFIPILGGLSAFNFLDGRFVTFFVLFTLFLLDCFLIIFESRNRNRASRFVLYRFIFRGQMILGGALIAYLIGIKGMLPVAPWAFVFIVLGFLILGYKWGSAISVIFISVLLALLVTLQEPLLSVNTGFMWRFFPAIALFTVIVASAEFTRFRTIVGLASFQSQLKQSESQQRAMNAQLMEEIGKRDQMEAELNRAQKMEAIGRLAAGVAHDLNNVLAGIVSYPDLMLMEIDDDDPNRGPLETIKKSGVKAAAIVQDLLTLSRRGVTTSENVDLRSLTKRFFDSPEYIDIIKDQPNINIDLEADQGLFHIKGSPVHLWKTIMNLVSNSVEAMPTGGICSIRLENRYMEPSHHTIPEGNYVAFSIEDTGIGISEEHLEHVFEPFYTTKVMGRSGTGLGMAVVWGTVKDHDGHLDIKSTPGCGTQVTMLFPAAEIAPTFEPKHLDINDLKGQAQHILVVDDLLQQREIADHILTRLGYRVSTVSSGEEAVAYLEDHEADLLVLDMIMKPGIDGLETYRRILEFNPEQKAIIVSGYATLERTQEALAIGAGAFLRKPYTIEEIGSTVQKELQGN